MYSTKYNLPLLDPAIIRSHYQETFPVDSDAFWTKKVKAMLRELSGLKKWRIEAPLSDTDKILRYGRKQEEFQRFVDLPLIKQNQKIRDNLFENIYKFIDENHPNIGLGADFDGYRGLDDNIQMVSLCLVLNEAMQKDLETEVGAIIEQQKDSVVQAERIRTLVKNARISTGIRVNSVCLYSITTRISSRIIQNIKRYDTPLERVEPVLETLFPFGVNVSSYSREKMHLNPLSPFGIVDWVDKQVRSIEEQEGALSDPATEGQDTETEETDGSDTSAGDKS